MSDNDRSLLRIDHKENITTFNQGYQHFIDYYGLHAVRTRIRHPRSKGKVESGVKYLKNNALPGKKFNSIKEINVWIEYWCRTISDERKLDGFPSEFNTPKLRFLVEKAHLRPIQLPRIAGIRFEQRKVSADGLVRVDGELYSLDMSFASKEVQVQISDKCITITAPGLPPQTRDRAQQVYKPIEQKSVIPQSRSGRPDCFSCSKRIRITKRIPCSVPCQHMTPLSDTRRCSNDGNHARNRQTVKGYGRKTSSLHASRQHV